MPNLVSAATVRALVASSLTDAQLDAIIEREEAEIISRYGAHYVDALTPISEVHILEDSPATALFLRRPVLSLSTVTEQATLTSTGVVLTGNTDYALVGSQGRLVRLSGGWGQSVTISYVPADDRAARTRVVIELVRLALARTAYQSENIAGEYSYTIKDQDWETQRNRLLAQLGFPRW